MDSLVHLDYLVAQALVAILDAVASQDAQALAVTLEHLVHQVQVASQAIVALLEHLALAELQV